MKRTISKADRDAVALKVGDRLRNPGFRRHEDDAGGRILDDVLRMLDIEVLREFVDGDMTTTPPDAVRRNPSEKPVFYVRRGGSWIETVPNDEGQRRTYSDVEMRRFINDKSLVVVEF